jgi:hypothetical protein
LKALDYSREGLCNFKRYRGGIEALIKSEQQHQTAKTKQHVSLRAFPSLRLLASEIFDADGLAAPALGVVFVGAPFGRGSRTLAHGATNICHC